MAVNHTELPVKKSEEPTPKGDRSAVAKLLQDRRVLTGYSRRQIGELVGISPGTIEGWEVGRVRSPAVHDVLRLAHFLEIPLDEIQRAVFDDAGQLPEKDASP